MDVRDRRGPLAADAETAVAALTVSWSGIWVGALTSVVAVILFGFIGTAIGAHAARTTGEVSPLSGSGPMALVFTVLSAFFAFVIGGWIATRIAGVRVPETAALYGAITFVVATVILLVLASQAAQYLHGWYSGLAPGPVSPPAQPGQPVDPQIARGARNAAIAAAGSMLIGLMGAVIGGWMGSGEPMTLTRRVADRRDRPDRPDRADRRDRPADDRRF